MASVNDRIVIEVGGEKAEFVLRATRAPEAYDGFGTWTVISGILPDREERVVAIRPEQLKWQEARYASGMRSARELCEDDCWSDAEVLSVLLNRAKEGE